MNKRKLCILILAGLCLAAAPLRRVFTPFVLAYLFAAAVNPLVLWLAQKRWPRWCSTTLILFSLLLPLSAGIGWLTVCAAGNLPGWLHTLSGLLSEEGPLAEPVYRLVTALPVTIKGYVRELIEQLQRGDSSLISNLTGYLTDKGTQWLSALPGTLLRWGIFLLACVYAICEYPVLTRGLRAILPKDWAEKLCQWKQLSLRRLGGWLKAQCVLSSIIFGEMCIGLLLLDFQPFLLLALAGTLIDMLPFFGSGIFLIPWAVIQLLTGRFFSAAGLGILWLIAMSTRTILEPRLVGRHLGLPPFCSLCAAYAGLRLWQLKGMILFPILAGVLFQILRQQNRDAIQNG